MGTDAARLAGRGRGKKKVQREAEKMNSCASRAHTSNFHFARGSGSDGGGRRAVAGSRAIPRDAGYDRERAHARNRARGAETEEEKEKEKQERDLEILARRIVVIGGVMWIQEERKKQTRAIDPHFRDLI